MSAVFSQTIGHRITDISTVENLAAMEVDPMAAAQAYRDRVLDPVRGLMPADVVSSIEEQLSGSCTTEIAAFDEFTGLLTNHELRENMTISYLIPRQPVTPSACLNCREPERLSRSEP